MLTIAEIQNASCHLDIVFSSLINLPVATRVHWNDKIHLKMYNKKERNTDL